MTQKDDALAAALNYYSENNGGEMRLFDSTNEDFHPHFKTILKAAEQALTQPPVDVEALKRECYGDSPIACRASIDRAIDHLVSKGYLK